LKLKSGLRQANETAPPAIAEEQEKTSQSPVFLVIVEIICPGMEKNTGRGTPRPNSVIPESVTRPDDRLFFYGIFMS
jgi:hypothetical protein